MLSNRISAGWRSELSPLEGDFDRILAVRLDNIGDLAMLGPALRALRAAYPRAEITLMASPAGSRVAPLLPWIDGVIVWRAVWQDVSADLTMDPAREISLAMQLRQRQFEVAFIFTSFTQSPYPPAYACYLAGIPVRVGHSKDFGGVESVAAGARQPRPDRVKSLVGMTSVPDLAAIIRRSSLVIANNSASLHLADAFMRPMVILYSGTEYESQWKPRRASARLLRRPTHCSPCYNFNCPYAMECLDIAPEEVVTAALEMLAREFSTVRADLKSAHKEQEEKIGAR